MRSFHGFCAMLAGAALVAGLAACATTTKVTRTDVGEQIDLSGNWNDTDSQLVSAEMVKDVTSRPWVDEFIMKKGAKPRVIVGTVVNKSYEHLNTDTFVNDLQRELTNSGRVVFVSSKDQRDEIREERADQAQNASIATRKPMGQEYGADYMMKGQINSIIDEAGKESVRYYQVELELHDMTTNEKVWIGQKKIKKFVEKKKLKF